jgi:hypothetical protein
LWVTAANTYEAFLCAGVWGILLGPSDVVLVVGRPIKRILSHCCEPPIGKMRMLPVA